MNHPLTRPLVVPFDVKETLLDIKTLQKAVTDVSLDESASSRGSRRCCNTRS